MKGLIVFIILLFCLNGKAQNRVIYNQYEPTASDYLILKWNINADSLYLYNWYVKESIDSYGRVSRMDFYEKGKYSTSRLCYLPDYVIYKYPNNHTIIEELYDASSMPMNGLDCEVPYKTTFTINVKKTIIHVDIEYFVDTIASNRSTRDIKQEIKYFKKNQQAVSHGKSDEYNVAFIPYYLKSYMKYNRIFPTKSNVNINVLSTDNLEYKDALDCIQK